MPLSVPSFSETRRRYLDELRSLNPNAATGEDSDHYVRASAIAASVESLHEHLWWLARQLFVDTSDGEYLARQAATYGLSRKPAALSRGDVVVSGQPGRLVPSGMQWQSAGGGVYTVLQPVEIGADGQARVAVAAALGGPASDLEASATLTAVDGITGVETSAVVGPAGIAGGAEVETDASLRARLLDVLRNAPAGGTAADYQRWALEVPGITRASVYPLRRGPGTVDVAVMAGASTPTPELVDQARQYIDFRRPVTADVLVIGPTLVPVNVRVDVKLSGISAIVATASVEGALADYFATLTIGAPARRSRLIAAIQDVPGIESVDLIEPAADVVPPTSAVVIGLAVMGQLSLGTMA